MNASSPSFAVDVAVVGTGLVGLATALGCARQGLRVGLIGPEPHRFDSSLGFDVRVYALAPATRSFLERLRVWQAIPPERIAPVDAMQIAGQAGQPGQLTLDAYSAALPAMCWIVEHGTLLQGLQTALSFQSEVQRFSASFAGLPPSTSGCRELLLSDGKVVSAGLVVAADGADSALRQALGIEAQRHLYRESAIVQNFHCEQPHRNQAFQWFTSQGVVALLPLPGAHVSLVWSAPEALAQGLMGLDDTAFAARVMDVCGSGLGTLRSVGQRQTFPLSSLTVKQWVAPQAVLLGDSAHVVHPLAGQGLNLGLQDAEALLQTLQARESFRRVGDERVLRRYERGRREAVLGVQWMVHGLHQLFGRTDPWLSQLRQLGMQGLDRWSGLKRRLVLLAAGASN